MAGGTNWQGVVVVARCAGAGVSQQQPMVDCEVAGCAAAEGAAGAGCAGIVAGRAHQAPVVVIAQNVAVASRSHAIEHPKLHRGVAAGASSRGRHAGVAGGVTALAPIINVEVLAYSPVASLVAVLAVESEVHIDCVARAADLLVDHIAECHFVVVVVVARKIESEHVVVAAGCSR